MNKYHIYIISKGRSESRLTQKTLHQMGARYSIVIEPQEYDDYAKYIDEKNIITTPFSDLKIGSVPARNFVMDYSRSRGEKKHWIMDDNIDGFFRANHSLRIRVSNAKMFLPIEGFCDRFSNLMIAGLNYLYFMAPTIKRSPIMWNNRVYSCLLIDNKIKYQWRGIYNEDTDLCLRVLKDGDCTLLFNSFLCGKRGTLSMKGGNTDTIYNRGDKRYRFAEELCEKHPDVSRIVWRYNRWHHHVDYSGFRNNMPRYIDGIIRPEYASINDYGMILVDKNGERVIDTSAYHLYDRQ